MKKQGYPRVEINLAYLRHNVQYVVDKCAEKGIEVAGVIKGTTGIPQCAEQFAAGGCKYIASSRLEQLQDVRDYGIDKPFLLLRIPMLSEIEEVVRLTDMSLNSEMEVLRALDAEAGKQGKKHKVLIMADLGDLREGYWDKDEMADVAYEVETEMKNLYLAGVGVNVGCYGSVLATEEKLSELVEVAEKIEARIGRKLEYISGGATSSFMRVLDGDIPPRVNFLRIGEQIMLARDLDVFYGYDMSEMRQDVYTLKAEVIEVKTKPTYPVGELAVDAFGKTPEYTDRGMRKKALIAVGKVDYGSIEEIFPKDKGVEVIGASSDHTILDIEDAERDIKVGDILAFGIDYASLVYVTSSRNVEHVFI